MIPTFLLTAHRSTYFILHVWELEHIFTVVYTERIPRQSHWFISHAHHWTKGCGKQGTREDWPPRVLGLVVWWALAWSPNVLIGLQSCWEAVMEREVTRFQWTNAPFRNYKKIKQISCRLHQLHSQSQGGPNNGYFNILTIVILPT